MASAYDEQIAALVVVGCGGRGGMYVYVYVYVGIPNTSADLRDGSPLRFGTSSVGRQGGGDRGGGGWV